MKFSSNDTTLIMLHFDRFCQEVSEKPEFLPLLCECGRYSVALADKGDVSETLNINIGLQAATKSGIIPSKLKYNTMETAFEH